MAEQKFTPRAENVLRLAQETALELGHGYVGCEHILLGLLREDGSAACRALGEAGVTEEQLREQLVRTVGHGLSGSLPSQGLTPRARSAVEMAVAEAMRFASPRIGTEHLLLGLLRDGGNMAVRLLAAAGDPPRDPDPLAPHEEQPRTHRRAGCRQDGGGGGARTEDRGSGGARRADGQASAIARPLRDGRGDEVPRRI